MTGVESRRIESVFWKMIIHDRDVERSVLLDVFRHAVYSSYYA